MKPMSKQEWRKKAWQVFKPDIERGTFDLDRMADYFYSLHLQELSKIREAIKEVHVGWYDRTEGRDSSGDDAFEDGTELMQKKILEIPLLAITDEE